MAIIRVLLLGTLLLLFGCDTRTPKTTDATDKTSGVGDSLGGSLTDSFQPPAPSPVDPTPAPTPFSPAPVSNPSKVPAWRMVCPTIGRHVFATNPQQGLQVWGKNCQLEGIAFYLYTTGGANRTPLYQCANSQNSVHFLSIDVNCETYADVNYGALGYVSTVLLERHSVLYRGYYPSNNDTPVTANGEEARLWQSMGYQTISLGVYAPLTP